MQLVAFPPVELPLVLPPLVEPPPLLPPLVVLPPPVVAWLAVVLVEVLGLIAPADPVELPDVGVPWLLALLNGPPEVDEQAAASAAATSVGRGAHAIIRKV